MFRIKHKVTKHLSTLCVYKLHVVILNNTLHEILMKDLSSFAPSRAIWHEKRLIMLSNKVISHVRGRSVAGDGALLVKDFACHLPVGDERNSAWSNFQGEETAIDFGKFSESVVLC